MSAVEQEAVLRRQAEIDRDVADVVADFYEAAGQPSRALLWRTECHQVHGTTILPPDQFARFSANAANVDPRRDPMVWVMQHCDRVTRDALAKAIGLTKQRVGQIAIEQWREIARHSSREAKSPTTPATKRLVKLGALRACKHYQFGELPPDSWPITRVYEVDRSKPPEVKTRPKTKSPARGPTIAPATVPIQTSDQAFADRRTSGFFERELLCVMCRKRPNQRFMSDLHGRRATLCESCAR